MDEYVPEENRNHQGVIGWAKTRTASLKSISMTRSGQRMPQMLPMPLIGDKSAEGPEKSGSDKDGQSCTCNTDKVDREIEKLKKAETRAGAANQHGNRGKQNRGFESKIGTDRKRIEPKGQRHI